MTGFSHPAAVRRAALLSSIALFAVATPSAAQTVVIQPDATPLNDTDCNFDTTSPVIVTPPCTFDGTRTVTYNGRTRVARNSTTDFLIDTYTVAFSGNLKVDGLPVQTGPDAVWPFSITTGPGFGPTDASYFFPTEGQTVNVTANYTGERIQLVTTGGAGSAPSASPPAYWSRISNLTGTVNSIDINVESYFESATGESYEFILKSVNPTAIVNNSTAVAGTFRNDGDDARSIQFGTITGTASVYQGPMLSQYPDYAGAVNTGLQSLYQLGYALTTTVTTQLDETGLMTPKVTVSQGIAMNGSKITGLAAGTAARDAVNKGQLDAAIASIGGGGGGGSPYLAINASGTAASATQTNSIAMGSAAAAQGVNSMAMGVGANVTSESGTAIGSDSAADSDAIGARAEFYATAVGTDANAGGTAATTVGAAARSAGSYATSIGYASYAGGVGSTAIGTNAYALRTGSVAIGLDAQSTHQNSTAIGSGAQTSADNQIVLGNTQTVVKVAGIDASTAAQVGPVDVVTVDASGTLGRQRVATAQEVRTAVEYISAVTDSQFSDLSGRVAAIDTRLNGFDQRLNGIEGGVAAAMAMGQAKLVPDANISMTVAAATYGGEQGYAGSISGRLADKVYISGSMSGNTGDKRVGGAVSATFGF